MNKRQIRKYAILQINYSKECHYKRHNVTFQKSNILSNDNKTTCLSFVWKGLTNCKLFHLQTTKLLKENMSYYNIVESKYLMSQCNITVNIFVHFHGTLEIRIIQKITSHEQENTVT